MTYREEMAEAARDALDALDVALDELYGQEWAKSDNPAAYAAIDAALQMVWVARRELEAGGVI